MRPIMGLFGLLYALAVYAFLMLPLVALVVAVLPASWPAEQTAWIGLLGDAKLLSALVNTAAAAAVSSFVAVLFAFLAAHGLAHSDLRRAGSMRALLLLPAVAGPLVVGFGLLLLFHAAGVPLSLLTLSVGQVVITLPLCFALIWRRIGARHVLPYERAARDLGASEWRVFRSVILPQLMSALVAAFLASMLFCWSGFVLALLLAGGQPILSVELWSRLNSLAHDQAGAVALLMTAVSSVLVVLLALTLRHRRQA